MQKEKKHRYVGNLVTKEFHSLRRQQPDCNVKLIENPSYFARGREAINAGYDACGNCSKYWKSRRNR